MGMFKAERSTKPDCRATGTGVLLSGAGWHARRTIAVDGYGRSKLTLRRSRSRNQTASTTAPGSRTTIASRDRRRYMRYS